MLMKMVVALFITLTILKQWSNLNSLGQSKRINKRVYINCRSDNYVHWYQQKDDEALRRILYVNKDGSSIFSVRVDRRSNAYDLKVDTLKTSHSAVYYCACWGRGSHSDSNSRSKSSRTKLHYV
uniref:Immunoglobulin domain-containing protein n=1 Tax=Pygocentrus nattereri TaxID=42514 RepID=A0AAR2K0P2_PYGNA